MGELIDRVASQVGIDRAVAEKSVGIILDFLLKEGPTDKVVTVYRGMSRETYSCAANCERRLTLGDAESYFKSTMDQTGAIGNQAATIGARNNN